MYHELAMRDRFQSYAKGVGEEIKNKSKDLPSYIKTIIFEVMYKSIYNMKNQLRSKLDSRGSIDHRKCLENTQ